LERTLNANDMMPDARFLMNSTQDTNDIWASLMTKRSSGTKKIINRYDRAKNAKKA